MAVKGYQSAKNARKGNRATDETDRTSLDEETPNPKP